MRALTAYVGKAGLAYVFAKAIFDYASAIQTSLIAFGLHKNCCEVEFFVGIASAGMIERNVLRYEAH